MNNFNQPMPQAQGRYKSYNQDIINNNPNFQQGKNANFNNNNNKMSFNDFEGNNNNMNMMDNKMMQQNNYNYNQQQQMMQMNQNNSINKPSMNKAINSEISKEDIGDFIYNYCESLYKE